MVKGQGSRVSGIGFTMCLLYWALVNAGCCYILKKPTKLYNLKKNGRWIKGLEYDSYMNAATTVSAGTMSCSVEEEL